MSTSAIKELRERTGAGMLDCKKALDETKGDLQAAIDFLRAKGLATAAKKSDRVAAEGVIAVRIEGKKAVAVEFNSETDFVAKNESFQDLALGIASVALNVGSDIEKIKEAKYLNSSHTVKEEITNMIATIGENMSLRRASVLEINDGVICSYTHNTLKEGVGKIGVLVALESEGDKDKLSEFGKKIAMHIASAKPQFLNTSDVSAEFKEREKAIAIEKARESGKPEAIIEKIAEGAVQKAVQEIALNEQLSIFDNKVKVREMVEALAKEIGKPVTIKNFALFLLGEGIEKQATDFAAEVASLTK